MNEIYAAAALLGKKYKAEKIVLFGSRARGDESPRSDIDLAVFSMPEENQPLFYDEIEQLPTLFKFDVIFISKSTNSDLLKNIERDGIVIMDKFIEKLGKLSDAVKRLCEAIADYEAIPNSTVRDGVIQRFEFCTELAWKAAREYLINQGYIDINSPKAVMKQAFADGVISDEKIWIEILGARNTTSHIYDDQTAAEVFDKISKKFLPAFNELVNTLTRP